MSVVNRHVLSVAIKKYFNGQYDKHRLVIRCPYAQIDLIEIDLNDAQYADLATGPGVEHVQATLGDASLVGRNVVYRTINVEVYDHAPDKHRSIVDEAIRKKFPEGWDWCPTYEDAQDEKRVYPDRTSDIRVRGWEPRKVPMMAGENV